MTEKCQLRRFAPSDASRLRSILRYRADSRSTKTDRMIPRLALLHECLFRMCPRLFCPPPLSSPARSITSGEEYQAISAFSGYPVKKSRTPDRALERHLMQHRVENRLSFSPRPALSASLSLPSENFARHGATSKRSFGFRRSRYGRL